MDTVTRALTYAKAAHAAIKQKRKYTNEDYIVHPIRVANIVSDYGGGRDLVAAAYLHDVVEDTLVTIEDIQIEFGSDIAEFVNGLTDVSKPEDGNRKKRKEIDRLHVKNASYGSQFIKCADIIDNSSDILEHDSSFFEVYSREKLLLLDVLDKVKDTPIWEYAYNHLDSLTSNKYKY